MSSDPSTVRAMLVLLEHSRPHHAGEGMFKRLWAAGGSIRAQMLGVLQPEEAETLGRLLTRIAEVLDPDGAPVGGSISTRPAGDGT